MSTEKGAVKKVPLFDNRCQIPHQWIGWEPDEPA